MFEPARIPLSLDVSALLLVAVIAGAGAQWVHRYLSVKSAQSESDTSRLTIPLFARLLVIAVLLSLVWNPGVAVRLLVGYEGDSFLTLTAFGRSGLSVMSTLMILLLMFAVAHKSSLFAGWLMNRSAARWHYCLAGFIDLVFTAGVFWLALSLVPQIYYAFYQQIFDYLPTQWVATRYPLSAMGELFLRDMPATTTAHLAAFALHGALFTSLWVWLVRCSALYPAWRVALGHALLFGAVIAFQLLGISQVA